MNTTQYNGWTNYETWAVKLWLDNDEGSQGFWQERTEEVFADAMPERFFTKSERAKLTLADSLKEHHEEALPELTGFAADLLNAAMSEVNWHEISDSLLSGHCKEYEAEPSTEAQPT